jgi:hypothetical protein
MIFVEWSICFPLIVAAVPTVCAGYVKVDLQAELNYEEVSVHCNSRTELPVDLDLGGTSLIRETRKLWCAPRSGFLLGFNGPPPMCLPSGLGKSSVRMRLAVVLRPEKKRSSRDR